MNQPQILIPSPLSDFLNGLKELIAETLKECLAENGKLSISQDEYETREDSAKLLKVSVQTLVRRTKMGEFISYNIGSRVLYKRAELLSALRPTNKPAYTGKRRGPKPKNQAAA